MSPVHKPATACIHENLPILPFLFLTETFLYKTSLLSLFYPCPVLFCAALELLQQWNEAVVGFLQLDLN